MLQCTFCYKYYHPDEAYYMDHCGGVFEYCCEKCQSKQGDKSVNIYQENGFDNRDEYLQCLAEDHGLSLETVYALAETLGTGEDFDGLPSALEDISGFYYE